MKKISILLLFFAATFCSCAKWLEENPKDRFVANGFYKDKTALKSALLGVYERFANMYDDSWAAWMGEVGTDAVVTRAVNDAQGYHRYAFTPSSGAVTVWYSRHYNVISRANTVLANVESVPGITNKEIEEIKAECRFLRAICYFRMVQLLGPVPLVVTEFNELDNGLPRASVGAVYSQIIEDLEYASQQERLPIKRTSEFTRVTRTAATAMLGKVYLTMAGNLQNGKVDLLLESIGKESLGYAVSIKQTSYQLYTLCKNILTPLIGTVPINNDYKDIFLSLTYNKNTHPEFLWQIQYNSNKAGSSWAKFAGAKCTPDIDWMVTSGAGLNAVEYVPDVYYKFNAGDCRRDWSCSYSFYDRKSDKWNYFDIRKGYTDMAIVSYANIIKFREKEEVYAESIFEDPRQRPTNVPFLRYSDVVLMCAESELMTENQVSSVTFAEIEKIVLRAREGMTPAERLTHLKKQEELLKNKKQESLLAYDNANKYFESIKNDAAVSQDEKDRLSVELNRLKNTRDYCNNEHIHAANEVLLWTTGLPKVTTIAGEQAQNPQPFNDYDRLTFTIDDLKMERFRELAFEGHRRFDLLRWGELVSAYDGVLTTKTQQNGMGIIKDYNVLYPLPLAQVDLTTNPSGFFQNPKY